MEAVDVEAATTALGGAGRRPRGMVAAAVTGHEQEHIVRLGVQGAQSSEHTEVEQAAVPVATAPVRSG